MPPRNPTTRCSPRTPKLKELETDEGYSLGTVRQLEYVPRPKPVVNTSTKKVFIQTPAFGDTKGSTRSKVALPQWGDLFNKISIEEYPEYIPHNDPNARVLDDQVFPNIRRSYLHMVARRTPIFPCIEVLKWLIDHMDENKCLINDQNGG
jgi:hypothetical protein